MKTELAGKRKDPRHQNLLMPGVFALKSDGSTQPKRKRRKLNRIRLISPYPGAKSPKKYPVHDGGKYGAWIAPYAGCGEQECWLAMHHPSTPIFASDIDPAVAAIWQCWGDDRKRKAVSRYIDAYYEQVLSRPKETFASLKRIYDTLCRSGDNTSGVLLSAVAIVLRRLTFGGVIRCNKQGELNVALSEDKLSTFHNWLYEWPEPPMQLNFTRHWRDCLEAFYQSELKDAIVFLDPPYSAPGNGPRVNLGMSPAYPGHEPNDPNLYADFIECLESVLRSGRAKRVVVANYYGEQAWSEEGCTYVVKYSILEDMKYLADKHGYPMYFSSIGVLGEMNKGKGCKAKRLEGVWQFGGKDSFSAKNDSKYIQTSLMMV